MKHYINDFMTWINRGTSIENFKKLLMILLSVLALIGIGTIINGPTGIVIIIVSLICFILFGILILEYRLGTFLPGYKVTHVQWIKSAINSPASEVSATQWACKMTFWPRKSVLTGKPIPIFRYGYCMHIKINTRRSKKIWITESEYTFKKIQGELT